MTLLSDQVTAAETLYRHRQALRVGDRRWTMALLAARTDRAAHTLRAAAGTGPANVAVLAGNRGEAVEVDLACIKAGLGRVSINPRLAADERAWMLAHSEARVLVYSPEDAEFAAVAAAADPRLRLLRLAGGAGPGTGWEEALSTAASTPARYPADEQDPSLIMYTSGTTGRPKGAVWTFATRAAGVGNLLRQELDPGSARRMVHAGSLAHGSGSRVLPVLLRGGCNVLLPHFDPAEAIEVIAAQSATTTFLVPTMVEAVVQALPDGAGRPLASLRHLVYAGAKMPGPTLRSALDRLGPVLTGAYGSCEAPNPVLLLGAADHLVGGEGRLAKAGRVVPGADKRLEGGELLVRAPWLFAGYWRDDEATAAAMTDDGYYRTGDLATVDDDGFVEIVGRVREMIISGGYNVYPAEVERVLLEHPGVGAACVYGVDHPRWHESVAATIVPVAGVALDEAELLAHCRRSLAGYKLPRSVRFADSLPTGATGKVLRAEAQRRHLAAQVVYQPVG